MDEQRFRDLVNGTSRGVRASLCRAALAGMSLAYRAVVAARNLCFDCRLRFARRADIPVVSVGNLTTGGTGKTPVVAMLVQLLQNAGHRPGIISRGYRSLPGSFNDEKLVLERMCPGVPHEQNASRFQAAKRISAQGCDVIVMDDGFQHRQLHRQLDIVLIDATDPFGCDRLLPRGLLREPVSSLRRADIVMITRANAVSETRLQSIRNRVRDAVRTAEHCCCIHVNFEPAGLVGTDGVRQALSSIADRAVFLFSGIGNPAAFLITCRQAGLKIAGHRWFADHHHYNSEDVEQVLQEARSKGAEVLVTTLKDLVKLKDHPQILALEIGARFAEADAGIVVQSILEKRISMTGSDGRSPDSATA